MFLASVREPLSSSLQFYKSLPEHLQGANKGKQQRDIHAVLRLILREPVPVQSSRLAGQDSHTSRICSVPPSI